MERKVCGVPQVFKKIVCNDGEDSDENVHAPAPPETPAETAVCVVKLL